jgi:hypothetical protein
MADEKPAEPVPFEVVTVVDRVRVTVSLLLKPGTTATVEKITTEPEPPTPPPLPR